MSKWFRQAQHVELSIQSSVRPSGPASECPESQAGSEPEPRAVYCRELERSESGLRRAWRQATEDLEVLLEDLPHPSPEHWRAVRAFFRDPLFWKGAAFAGAALAVISVWGSMRGWTEEKFDSLAAAATEAQTQLAEAAAPVLDEVPTLPLASVAESVAGVFEAKRAAYLIEEDFEDGIAAAVDATESGPALHPATVELDDYRFDFYTEMPATSVAWTVRGSDNENYYAYRLKKHGEAYRLERWAVIGGVAERPKPDPIAVPSEMIRGGANQISVIARGGTLTTLVNGYGIDFWREDKLARGGVGFLTENGEAPVIRRMVVRGNNDGWGRFLYAARQMYEELLGAAI